MTALHLLGSAADGGAETYFVDLTSTLHGAGISTVVGLRRHAGRELALAREGVLAKTFIFGGPIDILTRAQVAAFARRTGAKAIVAWMNRAARHTPTGPWKRVGRLGGYYKLKNYAGFDMLVGNTAHIVEWAIGEGWPADRIRHIPNFAVARPSPPQDRAALDTPADAPLLVALGRLHKVKAQDVAIEALAQIPGAYLWIAGAGPLEADLKAHAARMGVADRVRFLGWREDASALYAAADLCLFPSRYEPLGNVVIQAWAHGLPVVAAASRGPQALIRDGEDGVLVPIDDAVTLAKATRLLLSKPAMRDKLTAAGLARIEAQFSQAAVVEAWRQLLGELGAL